MQITPSHRRCLATVAAALVAAGAVGGPAHAADRGEEPGDADEQAEGSDASTPRPAEAVVDPADADEEVIVYGDRFARWDGTRWYVATQIGFPVPFPLYAELNYEFSAMAVQVELVMGCEKTWRRGKKRYEVQCTFEDIAFRGVPFLRSNPHIEDILQGWDDDLQGSAFQLYVSDDGRVMNVDVEGLIGDDDLQGRRQNIRAEQMRQVLYRAIAGFHMKLPKNNVLREGQWVEYDSQLFFLPGMTNSLGGTIVVNQLDKYKGHMVVQSVGEATIGQTNDDDDEQDNFFKVELNGVSIYAEDTGIMTERVWSIRGFATAGSQLADGWAGTRYFNSGRIRMLDEDEQVELGPTSPMSPPGTLADKWPAWTNID